MTLILITNFSKKPKSERFDKKRQKEDTFRCAYAPFAGRKKSLLMVLKVEYFR